MLIVAGAGPGNPKYLTVEVAESIRSAQKVIAFERIAEGIRNIREDVITIKRVEDVLVHVDTELDCILLASGDPLFYGIVKYLGKKNIVVHKILPGISSFQYMMASLGMDWQDAFLTSCHGREMDLQEIGKNKISVMLLDGRVKASDISKKLFEYGILGRIHFGIQLSYQDERIVTVNTGEDIGIEIELGLAVIVNENYQGR